MKKRLIIIGIILVLLAVFLLTLRVDFITSVIPGWHTTIYPPWAMVTVLAAVGIVLFISIRSAKFHPKE